MNGIVVFVQILMLNLPILQPTVPLFTHPPAIPNSVIEASITSSDQIYLLA